MKERFRENLYLPSTLRNIQPQIPILIADVILVVTTQHGIVPAQWTTDNRLTEGENGNGVVLHQRFGGGGEGIPRVAFDPEYCWVCSDHRHTVAHQGDGLGEIVRL